MPARWNGRLAALLCLVPLIACRSLGAEEAASPASLMFPANTGKPVDLAAPAASPIEFDEVWAYLMSGEERFLDAAFPLSDLAYFGAGINSTGRLVGVPDRGRLAAFPGRVHLVVAEVGNYALTHFCLDPDLPMREVLIRDIVAAAAPYDGVQIDFEAVLSADADNYYYFLALLKSCLGGKALSVALPARFEAKQDRLGYERIGQLLDRVVVMAYDEHWSTSEPGPVASLEWCGKVASYAAATVGPGRLVMGAPFYGRAWTDKSLARAYKYSGLASLLAEKAIAEPQRLGDIPFVEYSESVAVKVYYDDAASTASRLGMYREASVGKVAFWRLGQEDPAIWGLLGLAPREGPPLAGPPGAVSSLDDGGADPEDGIE